MAEPAHAPKDSGGAIVAAPKYRGDCVECGEPVYTRSTATKTCSAACGYVLRSKALARESLIRPVAIKGSLVPPIGPVHGNVNTADQWQRPAEIPAPAADAASDEPLKIPNALHPKDRPPESQNTVPFWPARGMFVDSDNHFPVADPVVSSAKLAFVRDVKPDLWVNLGDLLDFWLASRFPKEAHRMFGQYGARLQEEIDSARPYVEAVCSVVKQAHFIPGNHEKRHERLIDANPSLFGLRALGWKQILQYPQNFVAHPYGTRLRINKAPLYCVHGDTLVPERVVSPSQYVLQRRVNQTTLFGHTHKASSAYRTGYDENREPIIHAAVNTGHGTLVSEQTYAGPEPDWQHAFAYVEFFEVEGKGRFTVHLIHVIDGRFSWNGTLYDGRKWQ